MRNAPLAATRGGTPRAPAQGRPRTVISYPGTETPVLHLWRGAQPASGAAVSRPQAELAKFGNFVKFEIFLVMLYWFSAGNLCGGQTCSPGSSAYNFMVLKNSGNSQGRLDRVREIISERLRVPAGEILAPLLLLIENLQEEVTLGILQGCVLYYGRNVFQFEHLVPSQLSKCQHTSTGSLELYWSSNSLCPQSIIL